MSRQANPVLVGGFVLGGLALMVIAILVFSSGALFKRTIEFVTFFPGTVQGLTVGSSVEFQGVQIGQVKAIQLVYRVREGEFHIPVHFEVWEDALVVMGERSRADPLENIRILVEMRGLRARLDPRSLVTGQYMITLGLYPDTPVTYVGLDVDVPEIPAIESTRDRLTNVLEDVDLQSLATSVTQAAERIRMLVEDPAVGSLVKNLDRAVTEAAQVLARIDAAVGPLTQQIGSTLDTYTALAQNANERLTTLSEAAQMGLTDLGAVSRHIDQQIDPVANSAIGAFDEAKQTFASVDQVVDADSAMRANLETMLDEAARAARSLRLLADYLERNPDALIRGKYSY